VRYRDVPATCRAASSEQHRAALCSSLQH
jgi:hypothetical protein